MKSLNKLQLSIGLILMIASPVAASVGAYYKAVGDIKESLTEKINKIAVDVAEIKGYLKGRK